MKRKVVVSWDVFDPINKSWTILARIVENFHAVTVVFPKAYKSVDEMSAKLDEIEAAGVIDVNYWSYA